MSTRTLCPKCHGQRTIAALPVVALATGPSQASSSASAGSVVQVARRLPVRFLPSIRPTVIELNELICMS
jgi:hypothetical protein